MIELIEKFPCDLPNTVAVMRVKALYNTYSHSVGVDMFYQTEKGVTTAFFGGMDGAFSLQILGDADYKELNSYFSILGATVFCEAEIAKYFNCRQVKSARLYELKSEALGFKPLEDGSIKDVYDKLKLGSDGDIELPKFEYWYPDFCLRYNHGAATFSVSEQGAAVCGFMTEEAALITGVAVDSLCRAKGEGSRLLHSLIAKIKCKYPSASIFATADSAAVFYEKNGFDAKGGVAVCRF